MNTHTLAILTATIVSIVSATVISGAESAADVHEHEPSHWLNGSLNEVCKRPYKSTELWKVKDDIIPNFWFPCGARGEIALITDPGNPDNKYVELHGIIANDYSGKAPFIKITVRAKGKGVIILAWYCYDEVNGKRVHRETNRFTEKQISLPEWQDVVFEAGVPKYAVTKFAFEAVPAANEKILIDSIDILPLKK